MKRPILVAVIGYIIGIIWGLYFNFSIAFLYGIFFLITEFFYLHRKVVYLNSFNSNCKLFSIHRYFRYIKLVLNRKVIITIILFSIISNSIVIYKNNKFNNLYKGIESTEIVGIVKDMKTEGQYKNVYKLQVLLVNNSKKQENTYLYIKVDKKINLSYNYKIRLKGNFQEPEDARNYGGFNYKEYLKTLNIYGTVNVTNIEIIGKQKNTSKNKTVPINTSNDEINQTASSKINENQTIINILEILQELDKYINQLKGKINQNAKKYLESDVSSVYLGLMLGDTSGIDEGVKEQFRNSNMAHILAVSGMHISYIIMGVSIALNKTLGKKKSKIITIAILLMYMVITGFSPSITRAGLMGIMVLIAGLIHRKNDTWTALSISLFFILIYNPFLITNIGLQFSYLGTVGILLFNKNILKLLNKVKNNHSKIKEIIAISISAQIAILPLTLFHFNTFGIYFLITNILLSFIIGPIIVFGFIFLVFLIFDVGIAKFFSIIMGAFLKLILLISNISFLPFSKIYIRTPKIWETILFYGIVLIANFIYSAKHKSNPNSFNLRVKYMIEVFKYKIGELKRKIRKRKIREIKNKIRTYKIKELKRKIKKYKTRELKYKKRKYNQVKIIAIVLISILSVEAVFFFIFIQPNKDLKIHFVDVGQGDCCFIETPNKKTILIDGGGSEFGSFDVGKKTLIPYILDRGYTKVDYIFVSHFDADHVRAAFYLLWRN